ncbi:MAG: FtsX-like permease family protein [Rectinema sp.]
MPVILRMAIRNIREHRSKSLIIGILLALGAMILVVGTAFINASQEGIRSTFSDVYTGDIFISGISSEGPVSLFGVTSPSGMAQTPIIPDYEKVMSVVKSTPHLAKASSLATGFAMVTREESSVSQNASNNRAQPQDRFLFLFGIDAASYWDLFDAIDMVAGEKLQPGQEGLMINEGQLAKLSAWLEKPLGVGDTLLIQGFSSIGFRLRELPIVGVFSLKNPGTTPEQLAYIDIESLRIMSGMTVGANEPIQLKPEETSMLSIDDADSLFDEDMLVTSETSTHFDVNAIAAELSKPSAIDPLKADEGSWQFIVGKVDSPRNINRVIDSLNQTFVEEGIQAVAGNWQTASGPYGQSVDVVRIIFAVAIIILSIVAIIIIMNTFLISVIERTSEIGTMRAIGAGKGFVQRMFAAEAVILAIVSASIGAGLGLLITALLRALHIEATNPFFLVLFGGTYMNPVATAGNVLTAILVMILVGFIAHLYPVSLALKIQPVQAMQEE